MICHPIPPVYDENSRILILGSFPSVKSREIGFFYGHPQNRFWNVLAYVFSDDVPDTVQLKKEFLITHRIALWDVVAQCDVSGSSDAAIHNVVPNNVMMIFALADISGIFVNGKTAQKFYNRFLYPVTSREAVLLPSTSPANAVWSQDRLCEAWKLAINPD